MSDFDNTSKYYGRKIIKTNLSIINDEKQDLETVKTILKSALKVHKTNVEEENELFKIFLNDPDWWKKTKDQRSDINNIISVPTAWALTRTLNGYCFGEPIKYLYKDLDNKENESNSLTDEQKSKQKQIEILSSMLDSQHNHDSTTMATLCASVCGLGYKLALPATKEEMEDNGIPFVINETMIYPQLAGMVYSDTPVPREVMGFMIGEYYDENGEVKGEQYTCWTKYYQYVFRQSESGEDFDIVKQVVDNVEYDAYMLPYQRIPLIEVERNAFRKGDWEVAKDLLELRNKLISTRQDDIQQIVDYVLILTNCEFESEEDKKTALNNRLLSLKATDTQNPPKIEILKNALEQSGLQQYSDYLDLLIQETVGIPNRQERGGGGGDTGQAVKYRNGFRDLENNAGIIIPKMDKAELKFLALCIKICHTSQIDKLNDLMPYEIRCKFMRTLNDDIVSSAQAFATFYSNGLSMEDSLLLSNSGTDPSEITERAITAKNLGRNHKALVDDTVDNATNNQQQKGLQQN